VSVYGSGFKPGEVVCRFGSQVVSAFGASWQSSTLVTCVSPSSTQGQVAVEVSMNGGVDFTKGGIVFMYEQGIRIVELRPSEGRAGKAGQIVTVMGQGFTRMAELSCWFGDNEGRRAYIVSSSIVLCTSMEMQPGTVMVQVAPGSYMQGGDGLPYNVLPSRTGVASVSPSAGPTAGGTYVTMTGLQVDRSFACMFGAIVAEGQVDSAGRTVCQAPDTDTRGPLKVLVK